MCDCVDRALALWVQDAPSCLDQIRASAMETRSAPVCVIHSVSSNPNMMTIRRTLLPHSLGSPAAYSGT
jgi:hypothetical protein